MSPVGGESVPPDDAVAASMARYRHPLLFVLVALAVYAVSSLVASRPSGGKVLEVAATVDLTLFVPLLYCLLVVRGAGWPAVSVLPVFLAGLLLAAVALPDGREGALALIRHAALPAELLLILLLGRRVARARARYRHASELDMLERLRVAAEELAGSSRAADLVAFEGAILWYAFLSWGSEQTDALPAEIFTSHRKSAYGAVVFAVLLAMGAEVVAVHGVVALWSPTAAWIVTGLSVYGAVWLIGDYRAVRLRPTIVTEGRIVLRLGLRWTLDAPLREVERLELPPPAGEDPDLTLGLPGTRRALVVFRRPVEARGPYGMRRSVRTVEICLDEPERLGGLVEERRPG